MRKLELVLWYRCNRRCRFCAVEPAAARQAMGTEAALAHLRSGRAAGARAVDFGGGEPTLRRDLPELARAARALGYEEVGVKTNGLRLCYPETVTELLEAGVDRFFVSVWGSTPAEHDALSGAEGSFEMLEMGVKHVVDLGGRAEAEVLLTTETVPRLEALCLELLELGLLRQRLWLYSLFGSAGALPELLPRLSEAGAAAARAAAAVEKAGGAVVTGHLPPCVLGRAQRVYEPIAEQELLIVTPGGSFAAEDSPFEAGRRGPRCAGCARARRCAGPRPEYTARFGDAELSAVRSRCAR